MMRRGEAIPDVIDALKEKYGYENLGRRTLNRWREKYPLGKSPSKIPRGMEGPLRDLARAEAERVEAERELNARKEDHWSGLLDSLQGLRGVEPFPANDFDLAVWESRPTEPCWPISKGFMCRRNRGRFSVHLEVEKRTEFEQLRQHIPQDAIWSSLRAWKRDMAKDIGARLRLLQGVIRQIEKPVARGGLGLPVITDLGFGGSTEPVVGLYYAFAIYNRALSMALGIASTPHDETEFTQIHPGLIGLDGRLVVSACDPTQTAEVKDFLYRAEIEWTERQETQAAATSNRQVVELTKELDAQRNRVRNSGPVPPRSHCAQCPVGAAPTGTDTPSGN